MQLLPPQHPLPEPGAGRLPRSLQQHWVQGARSGWSRGHQAQHQGQWGRVGAAWS